MKITDPEVIRSGEKDLIDAVKNDLDLDAVKDIIKNRLTAKSLTAKGGQIVVHDNEVAFRLDFDVRLSGSLLFDREGNHIRSPEDAEEEDPTVSDGEMDAPGTEESVGMTEELDPMDLVDAGDETGVLPEEEDMPDQGEEDTDDDDEEMRIDLPDYGREDPEEESSTRKEPEEPETVVAGEDNDLENMDLEEEALLQEEVPDEDINDILKESRDFWEQKNES